MPIVVLAPPSSGLIPPPIITPGEPIPECPTVQGMGTDTFSGWRNWPPICSVSPASSTTPPAGSGTTDVNSFYFLEQLWHATRERISIINGSESLTYWPSEATTWGNGFISSITDRRPDNRIRITDTAISGGNPGASGWIDAWGRKKWMDAQHFNNADVPFMPQSFRIVLDRNNGYNPSAVTIHNIVDNGPDWVEIVDDGTITLNRALDSYRTKAYSIHGQSCTYERPTWSERWPQRPNDPSEREWGQISLYASGVIYDYTDKPSDYWPLGEKNWTPNKWTGKQLICLSGSRWKRYDITANTQKSVTISPTPTSGEPPLYEYWIVEKNAFWRPKSPLRLDRFIDKNGRYNLQRRSSSAPWAPYEWYKGLMKGYWSHDPATGGVRSATVIDRDISTVEGEVGDFCEEVYHGDIMDNLDFHISPTDVCNTCPDGYINPWSHQTLRGLQVTLESIAGYFIEKKNYTGGLAIPSLTPATMFRNMGVNFASGIVTGVTAIMGEYCYWDLDESFNEVYICNPIVLGYYPNITWSTALPKYPLLVHWTVLDKDTEDVKDYGYIHSGAPYTTNLAGYATSGSLEVMANFGSGNIGDSVVISWGWTRKHPKEFKYLYRSDWFVPDTGDHGGLVFPPTQEYPGYYDTRPSSSRYIAVDEQGFSEENGLTFQNGDAARFVGDNWNDPSTDIQVGDAASMWLAEYFNKSAVATPGYNSKLFKTVKFGRITSGDTWGFRDDFANVGRGWLETTGFVHTGTGVSGGSTTIVKDNTKHDASGNLNGFWASMGGQRFVEMVLEVETNPSGAPGFYEERPIIAQVIGSNYVTVEAKYPFSTTTVGKKYRIREPGYLLNPFRDRKVKITKSDDTVVEYPCRWNNDKSIWFETAKPFSFASGWKYEIIDPRPGGVWHRVSNEWYSPKESGIVPQDIRGRNWRVNNYENLPHCYTVPGDDTGGRIRKGDYINCTLLMELYKAINSMVWTREDITWRGDRDGVLNASGSFEYNSRVLQEIVYTGSEPGSPPPDPSGQPDWCGEGCWCDGQLAAGTLAWQETARGNPSFGEVTSENAPPTAHSTIYGHLDAVGYINHTRRYSYAVVTPGCAYHHDDGSAMNRTVTIWGIPWVNEGQSYSQSVDDLNCGNICNLCLESGVCFATWGVDAFHGHGDWTISTQPGKWGLMTYEQNIGIASELSIRVGNQTIDGNNPYEWTNLTYKTDDPPCPQVWPGDCSDICPIEPVEENAQVLWWGSISSWGYVVHASAAVIKWDVPNGLRFTDDSIWPT